MPFRFAILALFALVGSTAFAQTYRVADATAHPHDHAHGTYEVIGSENGDVQCLPAGPVSLAQLRRPTTEPLQLTLVSSTNNRTARNGMRILLRATDQLLERPEALLAFRRAAALWEQRITNPITVIIDVDYGPERFGSGTYGPGVIASASSALGTVEISPGRDLGPTTLRQTLLNATDDAQLEQLYTAIPDPVPATTGSPLETVLLPLSNRQALGFAPAETNPDPSVTPFGSVPNIGFNSLFNYDFDPTDGIGAGFTDFQGVVAHEIGHSLGFNSAIGFGGPPNNFFTAWDLFRVRPDAVEPGDYDSFATAERVLTPGPPPSEVLVEEGGTTYFVPEQVFFDGLAERATSTATGGREGGDGQQASHWQDDGQRPPSFGEDRRIGIMDPTIAGGDRVLLEEADLRVLQIIGYSVDYDPALARLVASFDGTELDLGTSPDPISIGDTPVGETGEAQIVLANEGEVALVYDEIEIFATYAIPEEAVAELSTIEESGELAPGAEGTITIQFGSASAAAFGGVLRFSSNAENRALVEIPFEYTTGGASPPAVAIDEDVLNFQTLDTNQPTQTQTVTISNGGAVPLVYEARSSLTVRNTGARSSLGQFLGEARAARVETLFEANFEEDFGGFVAGGAFAGDWLRVDGGSAALPGHSAPFAAYFGRPLSDGFQYRNNATGLLLSPPIDVSDVAPEDLVALSFSYYLQVEESDIASVVITYDDGETYIDVASSDGGVLTNTDGWESVLIGLSGFSGAPNPVRFGFRFVSDAEDTAEGWYIDDIELTTLPDENPFYTTPRAGSVLQEAPSPLDVVVKPSLLVPGVYRGNIALLTNDIFEPEVSILVGFTIVDPVANEDGTAPTQFALHAAYPNPFAERATVRFDLPRAADATLTVYDVLGREVARLFDAEPLSAGSHEATLGARGLAAGAYLVRLDADGDTATQRLLLVR